MNREVSVVMSHRAISVDANDTLVEAAERMRAQVVGVLPVLSHARLAGVVTDRDLAVRAVARGLDPRSARVREVMTADPVTCHPGESVEVAAGLMQHHGIRRLVVIDQSLLPVGILSVDDLALYPETGLLALQVLSQTATSRTTELDGVLETPPTV